MSALDQISTPWRAIFLGGGPMLATMESWAARHADKVRIVAAVSHEHVPEYLNAFDVLVLPSHTTPRWKEQFGRVLVEAMACETVVVGSSSGEISKVIGDAGLVFPEGDVAELVHHLRGLHDNPDLVARLGAKCRARALENFTHRRIADQTVELYRQAITGFGSNRHGRL